jgi:hypothetical protein
MLLSIGNDYSIGNNVILKGKGDNLIKKRTAFLQISFLDVGCIENLKHLSDQLKQITTAFNEKSVS